LILLNTQAITEKRYVHNTKTNTRFWLDVHLYFALSIGFPFVLLGLSGSLNVFRWDIGEWLNPARL